MLSKFSVSDVRDVAPAEFRQWAIRGTLLSAVLYTLIAAIAWWQDTSATSFPHYTQPAAAIGCWIALLVVLRGEAQLGVGVAIATFFLEVHAAFAVAPVFPSPGMMASPVIVMATGLLLGSGAALAAAVASVAITGPLFIFGAAQRVVPFNREDVYWLVVHALVTLAAWALIAMSLSALRRMLRAVREKEEELQETIARAPDGILVVGQDDRVLAANPAAERVLGLAGPQCLGRSISDVLADAGGYGDPARTLQLTEPAQAPVSWTFIRAGQLPVHVEVTWRQVDEHRRQLMLRDVSERVRADEARHDIEVRLAHAQRLEAVGQLAGGIAHDFNNLLMTIGGSAELLRREVDPEQRTLLVDEVLAAQERGAALTRQLLAFARREVVRPIVLDLSALVAKLQRVLQRVAGDVVRVYCDLEPDAHVRADLGQIEQALVNLVANARDAMPQGGACAIHVDRVTDDGGAQWVRLRVIDAGIGMDGATAARAFEPFFTTKPRGRGTGLGLASVHGVVMQSGGRVSLDSTPGSGTTVTLSFPYVDAPVDRAATLAGDADPMRERDAGGSRALVLVAEDDDSTRAVVGRILKRAGYRVQLTPDGVQALRRIQSDPTGIDLLITDVMMPGLTGPLLVSRALELVPTLRVIYMSGYPEDATTSGGGLPLGQDFLAKPFSGADLLRKVSEKLDGAPPAKTAAELAS